MKLMFESKYEGTTEAIDERNPSDIFDIHEGSDGITQDCLKKRIADYLRNVKGIDSGIVMITPNEYFKACADILNSTYEQQLAIAAGDKKDLAKLKRVILVKKVKFPLCLLNYSSYWGPEQEGRHRMYIAGELYGWDTKFPVMVVTSKPIR